jgi:hypothetical protein
MDDSPALSLLRKLRLELAKAAQSGDLAKVWQCVGWIETLLDNSSHLSPEFGSRPKPRAEI